MPFAKIYSAQGQLLGGDLISVEVDLSRGLHSLSIVGLPDKAIEESRDRVSSAIKNSGWKPPKQSNLKTVISLAPADLRKEGPSFDVPIALGYLLAKGDIAFDPRGKVFAGELALDGTIRPVRGALSVARLARDAGMREVYVPKENAAEAALMDGVDVYGAGTLFELACHLDDGLALRAGQPPIEKAVAHEAEPEMRADDAAFDEIAGLGWAKRGIAIAAAGRHNVALYGPPGTGKTLLAKALRSVMPPLSREESLQATEIHSLTGKLSGAAVIRPPMRSPHHTSSYASVIGGGPALQPGEITLAHTGALFLDELPEFDRKVLEALREPLEEKAVSISRAKGRARFPADFMLVAALNPCPCGNRGSQTKECLCTTKDLARYSTKLSGPIMDRIDLWIEVSEVDRSRLSERPAGSAETRAAREAVLRARAFASKRTSAAASRAAETPKGTRGLKRTLALDAGALSALDAAVASYGLSARGYDRTARLARTIADMEESDEVKAPHVLEALQYRGKR